MSTNMDVSPRAYSSLEALKRLKEGNERFCSGLRSVDSFSSPRRIRELAENGQRPFCVVLACSDSRVPAETIFDCGLGDLFVIRVAGNVISTDVVASIEFAAAKFNTPLCLVMGHTQCGAVEAAIAAEMGQLPDSTSPNLKKLIDQVRPSAELALEQVSPTDKESLARRTSVENVHRGIKLIESQSAILQELIQERALMITGAIYNLAEGKVDFFDEQPLLELESPPMMDLRHAWSNGR